MLDARSLHRPQPPRTEDPVGFRDQIAYFRSRYPSGFGDRMWRLDMRGEGAAKRLKRHRDPAIEQARALWSEERLRALASAGDLGGVVDALTTVLMHTTLVPVGQTRRLQDLRGAERAELGRALIDLLHGRSERALAQGAVVDEKQAFDAWVQALGAALKHLRSAWRLVSAPRALWLPADHGVVDPGKMALQARLLGGGMPAAKKPNLKDYESYRQLLLNVSQRLRLAGLHPADLIDALDFVCVTLAPRARAVLPGAARRAEVA